MAVLPSMRMFAPSRRSSCTCMKRFSKMVSTTVAVPSATASSAMNCACMSVAKPGYGAVRTLTARGRLFACSRTQSGPEVSVAPVSRSRSMVTSIDQGSVARTVTSPPQAAAAHRKVPVSMRSAMMRWLAPCRRSTPRITSRSVPAPSICAPMATSTLARSTTSGSRAAFSRMVSPSARQAAIIRFSVPVTVTMSVTMRAPFSRVARATTKPCSISICAPIACRPLMC